MKRTLPWFLFVGLILFAAVFVPLTAGALPARVASHFAGSGAANGYMSRSGYVVFMLVFSIGLPLGLVVFLTALFRHATSLINLPNRAYWLAPERREETVAFLVNHAAWFGSLLVAFASFVHWLVVAANTAQPPRLSNSTLLAGVAVFLACLLIWAAALLLCFRRHP
jgi:serine/threonine-protein kinase